MEGTSEVNDNLENSAEAPHIKRKENEQPHIPENFNAMESPALSISQENEWDEQLFSQRFPELITENLYGRNLSTYTSLQSWSEHLGTLPASTNDEVEELTLTNYKYQKLPMASCSNNEDNASRKSMWQNLYKLAGDPSITMSKKPLVSAHEGTGNLFLNQLRPRGFFSGSQGKQIFSMNSEHFPEGCNLSSPNNVDSRSSAKNNVGINLPGVTGNVFLNQLRPRGSFSGRQGNEISPMDYEHFTEGSNFGSPNNVDSRSSAKNNVGINHPGGIRTKVLSAHRLPEILIKGSLKGKGIAYRQQCKIDTPGVKFRKDSDKCGRGESGKQSEKLQSLDPQNEDTTLYGGGCDFSPDSSSGMNLRQWFMSGKNKTDKCQKLHIFKLILDLVNNFHCQHLALQDLRPSFFVIFPPSHVKYLGSFTPQLLVDVPNFAINQSVPCAMDQMRRKRKLEVGKQVDEVLPLTHQKVSELVKRGSWCSVFRDKFGYDVEAARVARHSEVQEQCYDPMVKSRVNPVHEAVSAANFPTISHKNCQLPVCDILQLEEMWYTSPEGLTASDCSPLSNIYCLGVLLFELFCSFESWEMHTTAMMDLRHRIFPPNFLSDYPKEAVFCLWLLHPEPYSRPSSRDILLCDFMSEMQELNIADHALVSIDEDDDEAELLLHFLVCAKEQNEKQATRLVEDICRLEADIYEVERRNLSKIEPAHKRKLSTSIYAIPDWFNNSESACLDKVSQLSGTEMCEPRMAKNIDQLEQAYFSMRSQIEMAAADDAVRTDTDVLLNCDRWPLAQHITNSLGNEADQLGEFFDGLCKYARYCKFEVRGTIRNGDILNSANVIFSLSFDRDEEYLATAGVSKKIKIFEFGALLNENVDIHYPVVELASKSKLSCVCWNSYIKNYLASTDYDGVIQLWDASTGQGFTRYTDHQKRAWSVDFSQVDPTKLASGSDDCSVKLWSIKEKSCISSIRSVANICCVQFSSHSTNFLAFGSADYKVYCYDIRNTRSPWCTLYGHGKAVSYVKFVDSKTLVSASTDNTLKLWDLHKTSASGFSSTACSLTLTGHTNEKNFVGLSVCDGYIACGSETNEIYAYYKSLPMPITSHKFGSLDPITGLEIGDDNGQFVSSVCWRGKSNMIVAANSSGCIKLLQMV